MTSASYLSGPAQMTCVNFGSCRSSVSLAPFASIPPTASSNLDVLCQQNASLSVRETDSRIVVYLVRRGQTMLGSIFVRVEVEDPEKKSFQSRRATAKDHTHKWRKNWVD